MSQKSPDASDDRPTTSATRVKGIEPNPWDATCPSRELIELLASRWVLLVMPLLRDGPRRNGDLLRGVEGVSQKMLTQTLREMEQHSLVDRHDYHEVPPRVEYTLTPLGRSLADTLPILDDWVVRNYSAVLEQRKSRRR